VIICPGIKVSVVGSGTGKVSVWQGVIMQAISDTTTKTKTKPRNSN